MGKETGSCASYGAMEAFMDSKTATISGNIATMQPHPLSVEILWDPRSIGSTAAAVVDVLQAMNTLAAMRQPALPPVRWRWTGLPAAAVQATPAPGAPTGWSDPADVLVLPGWAAHSGPDLRNLCEQRQTHWGPLLQAHVQRGGWVMAFFNGSALLAQQGLLQGRGVALPWAFAPSISRLAQTPPQWLRDRRWHGEGGVWSTASLEDSVPAWFDLLGQTAYAELAGSAAHVLCFDAQRQGAATQAIQSPTGAPTSAGALERARRWLQTHLDQPYSLQAAARAADTSARTLLRLFAQVHGQSPLDYLHGLRVAHAQVLLQTTYLSVDAIAQQCGYRDPGSFRKMFVRVCGHAPGVYRERFRLRTARKLWVTPENPQELKA